MDDCLTNFKNVIMGVVPFTSEALEYYVSLLSFQKMDMGSFFCRAGEYPGKTGFGCKVVLYYFGIRGLRTFKGRLQYIVASKQRYTVLHRRSVTSLKKQILRYLNLSATLWKQK